MTTSNEKKFCGIEGGRRRVTNKEEENDEETEEEEEEQEGEEDFDGLERLNLVDSSKVRQSTITRRRTQVELVPQFFSRSFSPSERQRAQQQRGALSVSALGSLLAPSPSISPTETGEKWVAHQWKYLLKRKKNKDLLDRTTETYI